MAPLPWLALVESMLYRQLMKSPTWHKAVEQVVKTVDRARHGTHPDDLRGTNIDDPNPRFHQHFIDELKTQLKLAEKEEARVKSLQDSAANKAGTSVAIRAAEDAESAWQELQQRASEAPKQGFMGDYMDALRGQINQKKPPP